MVIKKADDVKAGEITPKSVYLSRRNLMLGGLAAASPFVTGYAFQKLLYPRPATRTAEKLGECHEAVPSKPCCQRSRNGWPI